MINWSPRNIRLIRSRYGIDASRIAVQTAFDAYVTKLNNIERRTPLTLDHLKHLVVGSDVTYPVFSPEDGSILNDRVVRNLDMAATKPLLVPVFDLAEELEKSRFSPGRSSHHSAEIMAKRLENARLTIKYFLKDNSSGDEVVFVQNASAGLNKMVRILKGKFGNEAVFISSILSHHSCLLPLGLQSARNRLFFGLKPDGTYDMDGLKNVLEQSHHPKTSELETDKTPVTLFIESESNVTGYRPPINDISSLAKEFNARVVIDHTQGAANFNLHLPGSSDIFVITSGHKAYARDGSGAIIGSSFFFRDYVDEPGGGTIFGVGQEPYFARPPANQECGTQSYIAQQSFARALEILKDAGMDKIEKTQREMTGKLIEGLRSVKGLRILGEPDINKVDRGPIVSFTLDNPETERRLAPLFVSQALANFYNVVSRAGMFCAHPYMYFLQGVGPEASDRHAKDHRNAETALCGKGNVAEDRLYSAIRVSFSFVTPQEYLDDLPRMLLEIQKMSRNQQYPKISTNPDHDIQSRTFEDHIQRRVHYDPKSSLPGLLEE